MTAAKIFPHKENNLSWSCIDFLQDFGSQDKSQRALNVDSTFLFVIKVLSQKCFEVIVDSCCWTCRVQGRSRSLRETSGVQLTLLFLLRQTWQELLYSGILVPLPRNLSFPIHVAHTFRNLSCSSNNLRVTWSCWLCPILASEDSHFISELNSRRKKKKKTIWSYKGDKLPGRFLRNRSLKGNSDPRLFLRRLHLDVARYNWVYSSLPLPQPLRPERTLCPLF